MEIFDDFEAILLNFWSTLMFLQQNFKWNFNLLQQDNAQEGEPVIFDGERHGADGDEVFFGITRVPNFTFVFNFDAKILTILTQILQIWYPSHFLQQDRAQGFRDVIRDTEVHMHMRLSRPTLQNFAIIGQKVINY